MSSYTKYESDTNVRSNQIYMTYCRKNCYVFSVFVIYMKEYTGHLRNLCGNFFYVNMSLVLYSVSITVNLSVCVLRAIY